MEYRVGDKVGIITEPWSDLDIGATVVEVCDTSRSYYEIILSIDAGDLGQHGRIGFFKKEVKLLKRAKKYWEKDV